MTDKPSKPATRPKARPRGPRPKATRKASPRRPLPALGARSPEAAAYTGPMSFIDVVLFVDADGRLSLRSPDGASENGRVFVAMLRLRPDLVMGPTEIINQLCFDAACPEKPPERPRRH